MRFRTMPGRIDPQMFLALALGLGACTGPDADAPPSEGFDSSAMLGTVTVQAVDGDGRPIADAHAMLGGQSEGDWVATDADGVAAVDIIDDGITSLYVIVGKEGWFSRGTPIDPDDLPKEVVELQMRPLPTEDNLDYAFQPAGDSSSGDASSCGHCHWGIADGWTESAHSTSASNLRTWDLYTGSASAMSDTDCATAGGWSATGQLPGTAGETESRCYTGDGVLPWLNDGCGGPLESACDHPDERSDLERYGGCGDCHTPAIDGAIPGQVDLAAAVGVGFEGVTCDFCHKVREVTPGPAGGLDGALSLLRPSEPTNIVGQVYDPITFGPYADTIVAIMKGSYTPQFRESAWCSSCHEYSQPALHPDHQLAPRWEQGLPIFETWSEHTTWSNADVATCHTCHMQPLDQESSTYNISEVGLTPSVDQGWLRPFGEVRQHDFSGPDKQTPPTIEVTLTASDDGVTALVTVTNAAAGHAIPTGEPLRQYLVLVTATDDQGETVAATGGQVVPDAGGALATGVVGDGVEVNGTSVQFVGAEFAEALALSIRWARPTGEWVDYVGPGTTPFSSGDLSPEDKGLPLTSFIGEADVVSVGVDTVVLSAAPAVEAGDVVYLVQSHHRAGSPGWMYAKVLVDSEGNRGVAHYRAVDIVSDNRIAPDGMGSSEHAFAEVDGLTVTARLVRRTYAAPVADAYGWDTEDEEVGVAVAEWLGR